MKPGTALLLALVCLALAFSAKGCAESVSRVPAGHTVCDLPVKSECP